MKIARHEKVEIMPWHKGYSERPVNLKNTVEICEWCRQMHKYRAEPNATSVIDRWNIGVYQLAYIPALIKNYEPREFGEAVASAMIHFIGCFENCGVGCEDMLTPIKSLCQDSRFHYKMVLGLIPQITKQVYYYGKQRHNRFERQSLHGYAIDLLCNMVYLSKSKNPHLDLSSCLMLAMAKVQEREFKTHG